MKKSNSDKKILGVHVDPITLDELHDQIKLVSSLGKHEIILHANIHGLNLAYKLPWLQSFLNSAYLVFCDGFGVMLGARILGIDLPERITYADWMWQLSAFAESHNLSMYLLGADSGIAEKAEKNLTAKFPKLNIVGTHHGYFNKSPNHPENEAVIKHISDCSPNILLVSFGMPLQEKWLMENWSKIDANVALTGGAALDYVAGNLTRAPKWMTDNGLEWLGRLLIEPRRLWKRYIIGNPLFLLRVIKQRFKTKGELNQVNPKT